MQFTGTIEQEDWIDSVKPTDQFAHQYMNKTLQIVHRIATTTIERFNLFVKTFGKDTEIGNSKMLKLEKPSDFSSSEIESFEKDFLDNFSSSKKFQSVEKKFPQDETEDDKIDDEMTPGAYALNYSALLSLLQ